MKTDKAGSMDEPHEEVLRGRKDMKNEILEIFEKYKFEFDHRSLYSAGLIGFKDGYLACLGDVKSRIEDVEVLTTTELIKLLEEQ